MAKRIQYKSTLANLAKDKDAFIYIGRGSLYGNPWSSKPSKYNCIKVVSSEEAVRRYRLWLTTEEYKVIGWNKPTREDIKALFGKTLACYCDLADFCHGDVLIELAESYFNQDFDNEQLKER